MSVIRFLTILFLLSLLSCRPIISSYVGNVHRNTSSKDYRVLEEKAESYLRKELGKGSLILESDINLDILILK